MLKREHVNLTIFVYSFPPKYWNSWVCVFLVCQLIYRWVVLFFFNFYIILDFSVWRVWPLWRRHTQLYDSSPAILVSSANVVLGWVVIGFLWKQVVVVPVKFACLKIIILLAKRFTVALPVWHMGRQKPFHAHFFGMKNGMALDIEVHIQWKAEWEGRRLGQRTGYLRRQQLKGFQQWKWFKVRHGKPNPWANLVVLLYARIFREIEFFK